MRKISFKTGGATLGRFHADQNGNFALMTALVASTLVLAVGFAVNVGQIYHIKSNLNNALDAAVTSTARDLTLGKIEAKDARASVESFLKANADPETMAEDKLVLDDLNVDQTAHTVEATAYVDADLFFPVFGSANQQRISSDSAALYSDKSIEVAMMLDVTGSMDGQKIKDLKTAATNAIDAFLKGQDPEKPPRVRVAIVPYADAVNTGGLSNVVYPETKFTTGEPPKMDDPKAASATDNCATERKGSQQFTDASPTTAMVNRDYRLDFCPSAKLKPLSGDIDALKKSVKAFSAGGFTAGQIGIQWAWYMLSPKWKDVLAKSEQPLDYNSKKVAKYAILMTDGEFNTAYAGVPKGSETRDQPSLSRSKAETLCTAMRNDGIEIFSVGFMLSESTAKAVMKDCSTKDTASIKHYYETSSGTELNAAFLEIARNIERLALTK